VSAWGKPDANDLYGVFYFSLAGLPSIRDYYNTLAALTPLVRDDQWLGASTGYYISADTDYFLRLLYFTRDGQRCSQLVRTWLNGDLIQPKKPEPAANVQVAKAYGGQEARFRAYLCAYTQLGLDLLTRDTPRTRRLFASYRLQAQLEERPARAHFEPAFIELSKAYARLQAVDRDRFWADFTSRWDWEHMFVNMILAVDWDYRGRQEAPFSDQEVEENLRKLLYG